MGWKTFFKLTQEDFKAKYDKSEPWGTLGPILVTVNGASYYGSGVAGSSPARGTSDKIKLQYQLSQRIRLVAKLLLAFKAGTAGELGSYVSFYSDGDLIPDDQGYSAWGIRYSLASPQASDVVSFYTFTAELDGTKLTIYYDSTKALEANLKPNGKPLVSTVISLSIESISGEAPTAVAMVYEVEAQYYDYIEDMINALFGSFNMMFQVMFIMMPIMLVVSLISPLVRALAKKKEEKKEREEKATSK